MKTKRIQYDDDIVVVYDEIGKLIFKGMEEDDPYQYCDWQFDEDLGCYTCNGWKKECLDIY